MINLSLGWTKELLAEAVAEKGEGFVYTDPWGKLAGPDGAAECFYVHGDQPGCIVGHVLHRAGTPLPRIAAGEGETAIGLMQSLGNTEVLRYDAQAAILLSLVQHSQDQGATWGEAVAAALEQLDVDA